MAQVLFAGGSSGTVANLDANFTELYGYSKNLVSDSAGNVLIGGGGATLGTGYTNLHARGSTGAIVEASNATHSAAMSMDSSGARVGSRTAIPVALITNNTERARFSAVGDLITTLQTSAPALAAASEMVFTLTSNTNLRISVRGSDGTTRVVNLTLA